MHRTKRYPALAAPGPSFTNPLVGTPNSADPSIAYSNGNWYYVATTWSSRIIMRRSSTMAGLKTATEKTLFTLAAGPGCCTMWAPDIQWTNGRWYIYFSAEPSPGQGQRRTGALESNTTDPYGAYTYRGILNLEPNGGWAIDGSVVRFNGWPDHFVYSAFRGGEQGLFIAPMSPGSWTKKSTPIFQRSDANGVYGPGHHSFVNSPDGTEMWIVYHANSSASQGCGTTRTTRAQKINWNSDGSPNLGTPVRTGASIPGPAGDS